MPQVSQPLISVVIPVYNGERTISEAVRSVLDQTFRDYELLVINDGSQDSTMDILAKIDDPRLSVFTYSNAGLSASRNRGIKLARADYISFLDADDLWTPDKLQAQFGALQKDPEAAVCYSWTDFIDESGKRLGYGIHATYNGNVFLALLNFYFVGSGSNALIRKAAFDAVGQFDDSLKAMEDWDLFFRLAAKYHFVAVARPQILYRIVPGSLSANVLRVEQEMLKVVERAYAQEPAKPFLHLKKITLANLYLYLASRVLKGTPGRREGIGAFRFVWRAFRHNPRILKQARYVVTLVVKLASAMLLPPELAQAARTRAKSLVQAPSRAVVDKRGH